MKRAMLCILPLLLFFCSCTKEKSQEAYVENGSGSGGGGNGGGGGGNSDYFLKCKFEGTEKTFNVGLTASKITQSGLTAYVVFGKATSGSDQESFTFTIGTMGSLGTGTYKVDDLTGNSLIATYMTPNPNIVCLAMPGDQSADPFQVEITSISSTEMAGTFKGIMYEQDINSQNPGPAKTITEGQFKVKFQ